jgi:hypothetical protein
MPSEFVQRKWLCDHCPQMYDIELDCALHERALHTNDRLNLYTLCEQMETRIERDVIDGDEQLLRQCERVCLRVLERVQQQFTHVCVDGVACLLSG